MAWLESGRIVGNFAGALRSWVIELPQRLYWEVRDLLSPWRETPQSDAIRFRVLFVCFGNICRSPLAEQVFRQKLANIGLASVVGVDSAATSSWNIGNRPHWKARACAARHGLKIGHLRARLFTRVDFGRFDRIVVMDRGNREDVLRLAIDPESPARVGLLLDFAGGGEIPDPIYGDVAEFEKVFHQISAGCEGLVADVAREVERRATNAANPSP